MCGRIHNSLASFISRIFYARIFLLFYCPMMLFSIEEVNKFETSSVPNLISLIFSMTMIILSIIILLLLIVNTCMFYQILSFDIPSNILLAHSNSLLKEFFIDLRPINLAVIYPLISILKITTIILLVELGPLSSEHTLYILCLIQTFMLLYSYMISSSLYFFDIVLKTVNEAFYLVYIIYLIFYDSAEKWTNSVSKIFCWIVILNCTLVVLIVMSKA